MDENLINTIKKTSNDIYNLMKYTEESLKILENQNSPIFSLKESLDDIKKASLSIDLKELTSLDCSKSENINSKLTIITEQIENIKSLTKNATKNIFPIVEKDSSLEVINNDSLEHLTIDLLNELSNLILESSLIKNDILPLINKFNENNS